MKLPGFLQNSENCFKHLEPIAVIFGPEPEKSLSSLKSNEAPPLLLYLSYRDVVPITARATKIPMKIVKFSLYMVIKSIFTCLLKDLQVLHRMKRPSPPVEGLQSSVFPKV